MTQAAVEQVVGKLVTDSEFRAQVEKDPAAALAGFDLTGEERDGLSGVDVSAFHEASTALDDRVTKIWTIIRR